MTRAHPHIDDVAVARRMQGDKTVHLTKEERFELVRRWQATGRPLNEMERITGVNKGRYRTCAQEAS
jgi:hypothetical protein